MLWQVQFPQRSNSELLGPVLVATEHVLLRSTPGWVKAPQPQFTTKPAVLSSRFGYTDALQHPWSNDRKAGSVTHGPFLLVDGPVRPDCAGTLPSAVCRLDQEARTGSQQVQVMETVHPHGRLKTGLVKGSIRPPSRYPHCQVIFMAMVQGRMNPSANPAGWSNGNVHGSPIHASPVLTN